ncbi:MAG: glycosyltransferase family 39 protein [Chloroflexi bacterium]|nr:glycosyltransferase family 39 protein [Chloroflexota bacterium]
MSQTLERPAVDRVRDHPTSPASAARLARATGPGRRLAAWWRAHPDLAPLLLILAVGLVFRLALLYRIPPLFMPGDSQSFLMPGYDLARGLPFDPILKRPLGYPLLVAAAISSLGEDLRGLVFVQAMLGLVTLTATYWIGRLVFGRLAGSLAALSVAIGGQLLVYEHYILAESVFAMWTALAVLAIILAARAERRAWQWALVGGLAIGLASLFRPIAEVLVPLAPLYLLALLRPWRRALALSALVVVGFVLAMGPAMLADLLLRGGVSSGALGEHLLWRIIRSDSGYISRADIPRGEPDSPQAAARRYVLRRAVDRQLPQEIFTGLRRDLGLSAGEADAIMRAIALEAILRQPVKYVTSTLRFSVELFLGEDQRLGEVSKRAGEAQYINPQARQRTWFEDRILHLGEPPSPAVENEFDNAERLIELYQPGRIIWLIAIGFVVGGVLTVISTRYRIGLLLTLAIPPMLVANAALAGPEARFRYPVDPLIAVLAFGGLVWLGQSAWRLARRQRESSA